VDTTASGELKHTGPRVGVQTKTLTGVRTDIMALQLRTVSAITVNSDDLDEIIGYCVPRKSLSHVTIYGLEGNTAHIRADFMIDYSNDTSRLKVSAGYCDATGRIRGAGEIGPASFSGSADGSRASCPIWRQAIDWITELCERKSLSLGWTVQFCRERRAMCNKFGLALAGHVDRTRGADDQVIPNSVLSELALHVGFDPDAFPEVEGD